MFLNPRVEHSCICGSTFSEVIPEIQVKRAEAH
jgi:hypothetical protein